MDNLLNSNTVELGGGTRHELRLYVHSTMRPSPLYPHEHKLNGSPEGLTAVRTM